MSCVTETEKTTCSHLRCGVRGEDHIFVIVVIVVSIDMVTIVIICIIAAIVICIVVIAIVKIISCRAFASKQRVNTNVDARA